MTTHRNNGKSVDVPFGPHNRAHSQGPVAASDTYPRLMTEKAPKTTVLLIDGHSGVLAALARRLKAVPEFDVVGETGSFSRALDMAGRLRPALIIADFGASGPYGAARCGRICQVSPDSQLVIYTPYADEAMRQMYADAGASSCLLKDIGFDELLNELRRLIAAATPASQQAPPAPGSAG